MINLNFGAPPPPAKDPAGRIEWIINALFIIQRHINANDISLTTDAFTYTGTLTEAHTMDAGTGTLADVRNVLSTLVNDFHKRGSKQV